MSNIRVRFETTTSLLSLSSGDLETAITEICGSGGDAAAIVDKARQVEGDARSSSVPEKTSRHLIKYRGYNASAISRTVLVLEFSIQIATSISGPRIWRNLVEFKIVV